MPEENTTTETAEVDETVPQQDAMNFGEGWRDSLPDTLKDVPTLADVPDVATLAQRFIDTKAMVGSSVRIPTEEAGKDDINAFLDKVLDKHQLGLMKKPDLENAEGMREVYKNLGMPDEPSGYKPPEGADAETFGAMTNVAHELGLTKKQLEGMASANVNLQKSQMGKLIAERQEGLDQLQGEWGLSFNERSTRAMDVAKATGAPEALVTAIGDDNVDSATLRWLDALSTQMGKEGSEIAGQLNEIKQQTPDELKQKRNEITKRLQSDEKFTPAQQEEMQKRLINLSEQILATG